MAMFQFVNQTPFRTFLFESVDERDQPIMVLVVKGSYDIAVDRLVPATEQEDVGKRDEYFGEPGKTSVRVDTDLVPKKYHSDITLDATAHAPHGRPTGTWEVGVQVGGRSKRLRVNGPREWTNYRGSWRLSPPAPTTQVPIRYELAYGGSYQEGENVRVYEYNPVGRGYVNVRALGHGAIVPAPQLEMPDDPVDVLGREYTVAGLGPVPKPWLPRRSLCGTPDDEWKRTRWPLRPKDFDFNYYSCSSIGLRYDGFLRGDEFVRLVGLTPTGETAFRLPSVRLLTMAVATKSKPCLMRPDLDTVHLDLTAMRCSLCWRLALPISDPLTALQVLVEPF